MDIIETHYRANFDRLSKQWGRRFDNQTVGQDVVQEAYLRAIKYLHTYDASQKFDNWFGRVLHNSYKDFRTEEQGHSHDEIDEFSLEGIENHHEVDRLLKQIIDKIDEEKPESQEILRYVFQNGYSAREVSEFYPMSHRNIRKIVSDYRVKIRKMLQ